MQSTRQLGLLSAWMGTLIASAAVAGQDPARSAIEERVRTVLASEEAIESLRAPLAELSRGLGNLALPDARGRAVFADRVEVVDLGAPGAPRATDLGLDVRETAWGVGRAAVRDAGSLGLWRSFLDRVDWFDHASVYTVRGDFVAGDPTAFTAKSGFKGLARMKTGELAWARATLEIAWRRSGDQGWRVEAFRTKDFQTTSTPATFFEDVLAGALSAGDHARAIRSIRDETLTGLVTGVRSGEIDLDGIVDTLLGMVADGTYRDDTSHVCVVDLDRDGYDDFYVMPAESPAMFFRNSGDGTFDEIGAKLGLDLEGVGGGLFGDFDNDGDADLFLSFYPEVTRYYENQGERFEATEESYPGLALALSAVDYDDDGLLDVYLSRYNGVHIGSLAAEIETKRKHGEEAHLGFPGLAEDEARELERRLFEGGEPFVDVPGPPNVLLRNVGDGRFERPDPASGTAAVEVYYQTMASAWSDVDLDGDMDLYVVNEAGPNQLVVNLGGGRFMDVTNADAADVGFGMGAAFGDYDEDGRADIYVTNMYSKAGQRIAAQMQAEQRVVDSARGNTLLRNTADGFERVSGLDPSSVMVEAADFGWGGAFLDVDNDGALDLYAPAGYVTIPKEVAGTGDS